MTEMKKVQRSKKGKKRNTFLIYPLIYSGYLSENNETEITE
jgi:hypothetical protein